MKQSLLLTLLCIVCAVVSISAQNKSDIDLTTTKIVEKDFDSGFSLEKARLVLDTIFPEIIADTCANRLFLYSVPGIGQIGGVNVFQDLEKAQRFRYNEADRYDIQQVGIFFGRADTVGNGKVSVKIYDVSPLSDGPGNLLGVSEELCVSELLVDSFVTLVTLFNFPDPPTVEGNEFFVSVDISNLYETGDTVGIFMTNFQCGDGADAWELFADGVTWVAMDNTDISWGLEANFFMGVVLDTDEITSVDDVNLSSYGLESISLFPNPASRTTHIDFELNTSTDLQVELIDIDGKSILNRNIGRLGQGRHREQLDLTDLRPGQYILGVTTDMGKIARKLVVE